MRMIVLREFFISDRLHVSACNLIRSSASYLLTRSSCARSDKPLPTSESLTFSMAYAASKSSASMSLNEINNTGYWFIHSLQNAACFRTSSPSNKTLLSFLMSKKFSIMLIISVLPNRLGLVKSVTLFFVSCTSSYRISVLST